MNIAFDESFTNDLHQLRDAKLRRRIENVIEEVEHAKTPVEIRNFKRLTAKGNYCRIRVGDYRIGLVIGGGTITFVRCLNRKEIYRYFP